jgi:hypothetical protein
MTVTPVTRSLEAVLRTALTPGGTLRIVAATYAATTPADRRYADVVINGQTVRAPNLNGVPQGVSGTVCYLLADDSRMWVLGAPAPAATAGPPGPQGPAGPTGSTGPAGPTGPQGPAGATGSTGAAGAAGPQGPKGDTGAVGSQGPSGASTFVSGSGAPTGAVGVDGSIYLDTATGRMWGPKAAGAWPGAAFGRLLPLAPTYAQLTNG